MEGKLLKQDINDCISNLENHVHGVFSSVRASGEDFVYCPSSELFNKLDDYCDELSLSEVRPPLLIKGKEGTGKSALLANWLQRREHNRSLGDEFLFWHAVGCSRPSLNVNHLLRRLILGLKVRFELARNIPRAQERLSWELPRFLDLASKKGKIVIVIDGIHQLKTNDGSEDNLAWLPLELPANVRMILSVTASTNEDIKTSSDDNAKADIGVPNYTTFKLAKIDPANKELFPDLSKNQPRKNRILAELERRKIPFITVKPLDKTVSKTLIYTYIESTISSDAAAVATGPYLGAFFDPTMGRSMHPSAENTYGFLLFESQINRLIDHSLGGNPQFLRLFLKSLHFVCRRGYSLWTVFDDWIQADSVAELLTRILRCCEQGFKRSRESSQRDCDLTIAAGGAASLKTLYPWHPAFKEKNSGTEEILSAGNSVMEPNNTASMENNGIQKATSGALDSQQPVSGSKLDSDDITGREGKTLSSQVMHNLGDQESVAVERLAHRQLQKAVIEVRKVVDETWNFKDSNHKSKLIDNAVSKISQHQQLLSGSQGVLSEEEYANLEARMRALSNDSISTNSPNNNILFDNESHNDTTAASDEEESWEEDQSLTSNNNPNNKANSDGIGGAGALTPKPSNLHNHHQAIMKTSANAPNDLSQSFSAGDKGPPSYHSSKPGTASGVADPSEGFFSLPLYMRGGSTTSGFGDILGNALSLLYVARQGLKEQELWKILDYLQVKAKYQNESAKEKRKMLKDKKSMMRKHSELILSEQALIEVVLRAEDTGRTGYVMKEQLYNSVRKFVTLDKSDMLTMIDLICANIPSHLLEEEGNEFLVDGEYIHYNKFFVFLTRVDRKFHSHSTNSKFSDKNIALQEEEEGWKEQFDDDFDNFHVKDSNNHHHSQSNNSTNQHPNSTGAEITMDHSTSLHNLGGEMSDLFAGGGGMEQQKISSLGPVVEEMLLTELCALGVLYSPENKVLILPCDSDLFRQTIFDRYILPRGGGNIQYWHNLIIQYFRTQPNSLRKCEEMPWHLKICRKWTSLKDSLVDLKTFDLMFNNDLRDELMEYWLLLTEGPLYVIDQPPPANSHNHNANHHYSQRSSAGPAANGGRNKSNLEDDNDDVRSTFSHLLREIDESIQSKLPLKEIRKRMFQFQMQPFDVIEELNRSVENWVTTERPSPYLIHRTIGQIASFLLEFAKQTKFCPQIRRLGIDLIVLEQFGINLDELKAAMALSSSSSSQHHGHSEDPINALAINSENHEEITSPHKQSPNHNQGGPSGKKYFDGLNKKEAVKFPTSTMINSNFYLYLRWIWIQFPWLALHLAATVNSPTRNGGHSDMFHYSGEMDYLKTGSHADDNQSEDNLAAQGIHDPAKHLLRVWNVKKADPSVQVFSNSLNRKLAAIKPRTSLSSSLERNVAVTYKNLCEELTRPSHIAQLRLGIGVSRDKFRRTFQEEVESTKNIPFSYHGVRATKMGSLFPSYHSFIREKNRQQVERDLLLNDNDDLPVGNPSPALRSLKEPAKKKKLEKFDLDVALKRLTSALGNSANDGTGGGENGNTFFLTELDDEIRRITSEEYLQSHRVDRGGLIKDELDLEHETYLDRISRMKTIWNKLLIIQREKERIITELENAIILRQESDTVLINEVQSGEALIKTLNERNVIMEKNLREALILEEGYKELIKCLKLNPPYLESHVQSLEVEVSLAEKQFNDLCVHRAKLYQESHKLEEVKKKALIERIQYFKTARQEIQVKKKSVAKELKHLKDTLGKSFGGAASAAAINLLTGNRDGSNTSRHHRKTHFSKHHHHRTKGTNNRGGRNSPNGSDNENDIIDSSDSDSSDSRSGGELQLTKPVRHFLNAIVRKVTYNEPIIKETDLTFQDVKKRAAIVINTNYEDKDDDDLEETDELGGNQPNDFIGSAPPSSSGKRRIGSRKASVQHFNSDGRFNASSNTISNNSNNNVGGYDSESVTSNTSITRFIGSNNGNTNVNNSGSKNLNNNPSITGAAQGNPNVVNNATRKRLTAEQVTKLRNVVKLLFAGNNNTGANGESVGPKENLRSQIQKAVHLLFQKTESNTYEEFIERYMQDQVLLESLKSQQVLVDSRLAQLRAEHAELYAVWSDISFLAEENNSTNISSIANNNTGATTPDNTDRYLDNQLFAKEVRMHHYQRLCENSIHTISEARTAVAHLMRVLVINSKLLSNLPRSNPPELNTDADMASCLSWCEDRVIALNEALTMDANRPAANAAEENKPIAQRQTELASLIYNMTADKRRARLNNSLKGQRKQQGAMSKGLINAIDNNAYISSPRGVMITPAGKIDKTYDSKVSKLISERDKHAEAVEGQNFFSRDVKASNEVQRFLNEGLDKVETKNMSRRAKQLVNKRSGRTASYGLVLEELLQSRGQTFEFPNNLTSQKPSPGKVAASKPAALVSTVASSPPTTANSPTKIPKAVAAVDGDGRRLSKNSKAHD